MNKFVTLAFLAAIAATVQGGLIHGLLSGSSHHGEGHVVDYHAHPKYEFKYGVEDTHTGDIKNHEESRDGDNVHGHYTVVQPDGKTRVVSYHADKHSGFNADVKFIGHAHHEHQHHEISHQPEIHHSSGDHHVSVTQHELKQYHPHIYKTEVHHDSHPIIEEHHPIHHHEISHHPEIHHSSGDHHVSVTQHEIKQYHPHIIKTEVHHDSHPIIEEHHPIQHHEISHHPEIHHSSGDHHVSVTEHEIKQHHPHIYKTEVHHDSHPVIEHHQPIEHHHSVSVYETEQHHPISHKVHEHHGHDSHHHQW